MTLTEDLAVLRTDANRILRRIDGLADASYVGDVEKMYRAIAVIADEMAEFALLRAEETLDNRPTYDLEEYEDEEDDDYSTFDDEA